LYCRHYVTCTQTGDSNVILEEDQSSKFSSCFFTTCTSVEHETVPTSWKLLGGKWKTFLIA
jgi:hypothetical protein